MLQMKKWRRYQVASLFSYQRIHEKVRKVKRRGERERGIEGGRERRERRRQKDRELITVTLNAH